jgi:epoxyqueuosine reductase
MKITLNSTLKGEIAAQAEALGFAACGFAGAGKTPAHRTAGAMAGRGMHGTMEWMESRQHHRRSPQGLWPEAQSVIALGMSYAPPMIRWRWMGMMNAPGSRSMRRGRLPRYREKALKHLARWIVERCAKDGIEAGVKVFVDTAPVMEKPLGEAAGWAGRASIRTSCHARMGRGCFWARSTPRWIWSRM